MKSLDKALGIVVIISILVLAFGDIGFDKPGKFGLDFGHFLIISTILLICVFTLFIRLIYYIYRKSGHQGYPPEPPTAAQ